MADTAQDEDEGAAAAPRGEAIARGAAWLVGAVSLVGGLTWILLNLGSAAALLDLVVGAVLAAGGLVLLMPHRVRLPRRLGWSVAAGAGVVGTLAGIASSTAQVCCSFAYAEARGFPFRWLSRAGLADDPDIARRLVANSSWEVDVASMLVDVVVWAYAGILILTVVLLVRRMRARR
jgi:hypothetical protein